MLNDEKPFVTSRRNALRVLLLGAATATASSLATRFSVGGSALASPTRPAYSKESLMAAAPEISIAYPFELPPLPYDYDALQPVIIDKIMRIHHDRHHAGYTKKLNAALKDEKSLQSKPILSLLTHVESLPDGVKTAVRNNGGGYFNHALFWQMMSPDGGGTPTGKLNTAINNSFGSFDSFKEAFSKAAKTLFGSGWAWLVSDAKGDLEILQTPNQDTPLMHGMRPVLGIDVWEHAYYLQYENKRAEYVDNFWNVVNWKQCEKNYTG